MSKTVLNNNQKAFITEVALEVDNVLKAAFDDAEIEIDKLRDQLPETYGEEIDEIVNKVYHESIALMEKIRNDILNINLNEQ